MIRAALSAAAGAVLVAVFATFMAIGTAIVGPSPDWMLLVMIPVFAVGFALAWRFTDGY
jgi:hypothetical protein